MLLAGLLMACGLVLLGVRRVPDGSARSVHRRRRHVRSLGPGWHLVWPLLDRIGPPVTLIGHRVELVPPRGGSAAVFYQILEPERTGATLDRIDGWMADEARRVLAEVVQAGPGADPALCDRLKTALNQRVAARGLRVTRCQLQAA